MSASILLLRLAQFGFPFLFGLLFVALYWLNARSARLTHHRIWHLPLDAAIPFLPNFALIYFSAYLLGVMAYLVLFAHPLLPRVVGGYLAVFGVCAATYFFFPSRVERREHLTPTTWPLRLLIWFQRAAKPYNCFPSMHTAFCFYSALTVFRFGPSGWGASLLGWAALVALSTLLTKQHYLADALAGVSVALAVVWLIL
jgi:membrane-associated phospholipid phosphatase